MDLREYDLPLHVRASIDKSVFVGKWYQVKCKGNDEEPEIRYEPRGIIKEGTLCVQIDFTRTFEDNTKCNIINHV